MNQALVYIVVSLFLMIIMYWAKSQGHDVTSNTEIFRYPQRLLMVLFLCCPIPIIVSVVVCIVSIPSFSINSSILLITFGFICSILAVVFYRRSKMFMVEISRTSITISCVKRIAFVYFSDVNKAKVVHGIRSSYIRLYTRDHNKSLILYSSLEDFDRLVELIRVGVESSGGSYERIDAY